MIYISEQVHYHQQKLGVYIPERPGGVKLVEVRLVEAAKYIEVEILIHSQVHRSIWVELHL